MKTIYLHFEEGSNQVMAWSSSPANEDIEIQVEDDHKVLISPLSFIYDNGQLVESNIYLLEEARKEKDAELNMACNAAILSGFDHIIDGVEYHFSYDQEAQGNFRDAKEVLKDGVVESINWTVQKDGQYMRIPIDLETLQALQITILYHKDSNISKYREKLLPMVYAETTDTVEKVQAITWDSV